MPSISTTRQEHDRYCTQPYANDPYGNRSQANYGGEVGDVRRCEHGHLMLAVEVPGLVPPMWRTLDPVWTPILFWRARRALA